MANTILLDATNLVVDILVNSNGLTVETRTLGLGLDRVRLLGFGLRPGKTALALRLKAAILAGRVFGPGTIHVDVNGRTYLHADACVMGRTMNADLKKLGF